MPSHHSAQAIRRCPAWLLSDVEIARQPALINPTETEAASEYWAIIKLRKTL
jgi:hypothetical protein